MREIKFRAKRFNYANGLYDISCYGVPVKTSSWSKKVQWSMLIFENGVINHYPIDIETLGQFTGLYDENGKEIYEGDILGGIWYPSSIKWCDKCKSFEVFDEDDVCYCCSGDVMWQEIVSCDNLEVIGNIYDNKELLNE